LRYTPVTFKAAGFKAQDLIVRKLDLLATYSKKGKKKVKNYYRTCWAWLKSHEPELSRTVDELE
jgi:hypothetical protein